MWRSVMARLAPSAIKPLWHRNICLPHNAHHIFNNEILCLFDVSLWYSECTRSSLSPVHYERRNRITFSLEIIKIVCKRRLLARENTHYSQLRFVFRRDNTFVGEKIHTFKGDGMRLRSGLHNSQFNSKRKFPNFPGASRKKAITPTQQGNFF